MATKTANIPWSHNEDVSAEEWIRRTHDLVGDSLDNLYQLNGEMYMSDYRNFIDFGWRLENAVKKMNGEKP